MKSSIKSNVIRFMMVLLSGMLFSFSPNKGGDSFEIWLNGKKILQQVVHVSKGVQTIHLSPNSESDRLDIYYSHCGQVGKNRYITVKDEKNRVLKVWKFVDQTGNNPAMSFKLKDILSLKKSKSEKLSLFYTSQELPDGRFLAIIESGVETGIARK